ncbi:EFH1 [Candida margitis]|uniref:EFH1 n=1 Tax=Candida margitis TaxID=1775924 RepID=UPI0022270C1C|nr:EFH1 [Candida margitis]KAI5969440.1 EFH1 [Candida margitis]
MNKVMTTPSNASFYGSDIVNGSNAEQISLASKKTLHESEPEKMHNSELHQQTLNIQAQQPQKETSNPVQTNGIEGPSSYQYQHMSQNKSRGQQNYAMDYSNYYAMQPGYSVIQNAELLNSATSMSTANNGYSDYQTGINSVVSPMAQTTNQDIAISKLKQQQYAPSQSQFTQQVYSQQSPYSIFQQQDFYATNFGAKSRNNSQQSQTYSTKNGYQAFNSNSSQLLYQGEKTGLESDENDLRHRHNQQSQHQQSQHLLNQAFTNPSAMSYTQVSLPQSSLTYASPSVSQNYQGYPPQRSYQQSVSKSKPQMAVSTRNQSVSSTLTNKSRNSSTFSNNDDRSRTTSISSCIPQTEPPANVVRPRIATLSWEEEKTNCYQVRAKNVLVSRREDNNYINCTKLLNVVGMSRGKRDGILKTEKVKNVVKVGTMNLKGVWIPFDRAYEIARNEGVDVLLHPLFVRNIKEYFLTEGYKLKNEEDLEKQKSKENESDDKTNLKLLDTPIPDFDKSTSCPTGGYATSLASNDSKEYEI